MLPSGHDKSASAGSFGVAAGYEFGNGLGADIRYDDLGVRETVSPLQAVTFGGRYALPFPVMPFVEARAGVDFDALHPYFGASGAIGVAVPVARQLAFKLTARDWLSAPEGQVQSYWFVRSMGAIICPICGPDVPKRLEYSLDMLASTSSLRDAIVLALTAGLLLGCAGPVEHARRDFSAAFLCPEQRIIIKPVEDQPPGELAGDPERVAMWRARNGNTVLFEVTGCNKHMRMRCPTGSADGEDPKSCTSADLDSFALRPDLPGRIRPGEPVDADSARLLMSLPGFGAIARAQLERAQAERGRPAQFGVATLDVAGRGIVVAGVLPSGPADGRLRAGDVIVSANGELLSDVAGLERFVKAHPEDDVTFGVRRDGVDVSVGVHLGGP